MSVYIIFALLLLVSNVEAKNGLHVGVNASAVNTYLIDSRLYGDVDYRPKFTYGPIVGFAAGYNFRPHIGIQTEVNYARLGQKYEYDDSTNISPYKTTQRGKVTLDYFQLPILLSFSSGNHYVRFSAMAGPQFGFLTKGWSRKTKNGEAVNTKADFNKTDIGLLIAAGTNFSLERHISSDIYLNIAARMYYGFKKVNKNPDIMAPSPFPGSQQREDNLLNAYIGLNIGVLYFLTY